MAGQMAAGQVWTAARRKAARTVILLYGTGCAPEGNAVPACPVSVFVFVEVFICYIYNMKTCAI